MYCYRASCRVFPLSLTLTLNLKLDLNPTREDREQDRQKRLTLTLTLSLCLTLTLTLTSWIITEEWNDEENDILALGSFPLDKTVLDNRTPY
jgi:hypothetical protein